MREISSTLIQQLVTDMPTPTNGGEIAAAVQIVANRLQDTRANQRELNVKDIETTAAQLIQRAGLTGGIYQDPFASDTQGNDGIVIIITESGQDGYAAYDNSVFEEESYAENLETILSSTARRGFLPNWFQSTWLQFEDEGSLKYRIANAAVNFSDIENAVIPGETDSETSDETDSETGDETDSETGDEQRSNPTGNVLPHLNGFVAAEKGGLRNDRDEVEAIEELQEFLVSLGLNVGNNGVDGKYGPRTTEAVQAFQRTQIDLEPDGDAGRYTISSMTDVVTDFNRMQELLNILEEQALGDSVVPFQYKSSIAKLLERNLNQEEVDELERLLQNNRQFIDTFPEFKNDVVERATTTIQNGGLVTTSDEQGGVTSDETDSETSDEQGGVTSDETSGVTSDEQGGVTSDETDGETSDEQGGVTSDETGSESISGTDNGKSWVINQNDNQVIVTPSDTDISLVLNTLEEVDTTRQRYGADLVEERDDGQSAFINYSSWPNLLDAWIPLVDGVRTPEEVDNFYNNFFGIDQQTVPEMLPLSDETTGVLRLGLQGADVTEVYVTRQPNTDEYTFMPVRDGRIQPNESIMKTLDELTSINRNIHAICSQALLRTGASRSLDDLGDSRRLARPTYSTTGPLDEVFAANAKLYFRTDLSRLEQDRLFEATRTNIANTELSQEVLEDLFNNVVLFQRVLRGQQVTRPFHTIVIPRIRSDGPDDSQYDQRVAEREEIIEAATSFVNEIRDLKDRTDDSQRSEYRTALQQYTREEQDIIIDIWEVVDQNFGSDDAKLLSAIAQITSPEQWERIYSGYQIVSGSRTGPWIDIQNQWTISQATETRIRNHFIRHGIIQIGNTSNESLDILSLYKKISRL